MIASSALKRLEERGITLEQVKSIVEGAKEVVNVRYGRKAVFKQFRDRTLGVKVEG